MHQPREDAYLFRALRARDPECGPLLDALERDHRREPEAMAHVAELLDAFEENFPEGREAFVTALGDYIDSARAHTRLEESEAHPLAQRHLTAEDWEAINAVFSANNRNNFV